MNRLFLIVGPSGSGKSTLARNLQVHGVPEVVSHTSRPRRGGEVDGINYHFVSAVEFRAMVDRGAMLEHVLYNGNLYGVSQLSAANALMNGPACLVVEARGAAQIKAALRDRVLVLFLEPSTVDELRRRMIDRGDPAELVEQRLALVEQEVAAAVAVADHRLQPGTPEELLAEALRIVDGRPILPAFSRSVAEVLD